MKVKYENSAGGIVFKKNTDLLFLITQHSQHKGWVFPKGLIADEIKNEPMEQAALREVKEEGGVFAKVIDKTPITVNYSYKYKDLLVKKTVNYFLMEYVSGDPKDHDWEMMDAKFVNEGEVKKTLTYPTDKQAFEKILKLLK